MNERKQFPLSFDSLKCALSQEGRMTYMSVYGVDTPQSRDVSWVVQYVHSKLVSIHSVKSTTDACIRVCVLSFTVDTCAISNSPSRCMYTSTPKEVCGSIRRLGRRAYVLHDFCIACVCRAEEDICCDCVFFDIPVSNCRIAEFSFFLHALMQSYPGVVKIDYREYDTAHCRRCQDLFK